MSQQLLVVDADELLRRSLAEQLVARGFIVSQAATAESGLRFFAQVDLVLLEATLPEAEWFCQQLLEKAPGKPLIVLATSLAHMTSFGALGVHDCLAKPYRLTHLVERIETHLLSSQKEVSAPRIGTFRLSRQNRLMTDDSGCELRLTEKEAAILEYLILAEPRAVPRQELLDEVWGYAGTVSTHTVETHVYRLRRKLDAKGAPTILSEKGGYRLASLSKG
ncbi:MAG TPA: response regulator transcription factor [Rhodospirillaceae bacterium]|nr:response regulator transcription factor [Rhodospirillaceae bacterium]